MTKSRAARRPLWLIVCQDNGRMEVLTIESDSGRTSLPVFSFEEEAETFLQLEAPERDWQIRETTAGELISVLYGPCEDVEKVSLDPLPVVDGRAMVDLVSLGRERFIQGLTGESKTSAPHWNLQTLPGSEDSK